MNEVRRLSYVAVFTGSDGLQHVGCIHYFIHVGKHQEDYLVAAMSVLRGVDSDVITKHPVYNVSLLCLWPPAPLPTILVRVEQLQHTCLLVHIDGEKHNGREVAHIIKYIHKSVPDPRWWAQGGPSIL
jgi:hypothetical protein